MLRLVDLDPKWVLDGDKRVGFTFVSPLDPKFRQSCFVESPPTREQWRLFVLLHGAEDDDDDWPRDLIQGCTPGTKWSFAGGIENADFATLTVVPSIDGSAGGLWHGHIQNGLIVGGLE